MFHPSQNAPGQVNSLRPHTVQLNDQIKDFSKLANGNFLTVKSEIRCVLSSLSGEMVSTSLCPRTYYLDIQFPYLPVKFCENR